MSIYYSKVLLIGCFHATKSACKENETLAKAGCRPAAVTTELFACIVTGFTPVPSCPWEWGVAEESSAANCVLSHKQLFSDTNIRMSPSLQTRHVWKLVK